MTVAVNVERKGIEISWDPQGHPVEPPPDERPPGYPAHPIVLPPEDAPHPEHPIFLPPYIWGPTDPRPSNPIELPPEIADGVDDEELKQAILDFALGNLPPYEGGPSYPAPVDADGIAAAVQIFGQGQEGDWSNTAVQPNDGLAFLSYPLGFTGESYIEVRSLDGKLVDSGTITIS